jgi:TPR repeat protein
VLIAEQVFSDGKGVAQNYAKAQAWYQKSAAAGNTDAMVSLGVMFHNGIAGARGRPPAMQRHPQTRSALKGELARLGHYSGAINDLWDDAARAAYYAYVKNRAAARPDQAGCLSFHEVHPTVLAKEAAQT